MKLAQVRDYAIIFVGAMMQAACMVLFLIPAQLAAGGVSGAALIVNKFTGWPIGMMVLAGNLPLFWLGWRYLGGRRFLLRTVFASVVFSVGLDSLTLLLPRAGLTHDLLLNALYGGVIGGIGSGLVIRAQGTSGGTEILARLLSLRYGISLSQSYLYTDSVVVLVAGLAFSWEQALYAIIALYVWGVATDLFLEGSDVARTATIVTEQPEAVARHIMDELARGITAWPGTGLYSGRNKQVLFCVVSRAEVAQLKAIIHEADPQAFVVIGVAHEALGEGFKPLSGAHRLP